MRADLSVVIICKNASGYIARTLASVQALSCDIVVYDTGSTDDTMAIARSFGANVFEGPWEGFGKTRAAGTGRAQKDWIFTLDADESVEPELFRSLQQLPLNDELTVYKVRLANHLGDQPIHHGAWGNDRRIRLFNRRQVQWSDAPVHETLLLPAHAVIVPLEGFIHHRTAANLEAYRRKLVHYAEATAAKYFAAGRRANLIKCYGAPVYAFIKNYFLKLGFLDGYNGFALARILAGYTYQKYVHLRQLELAQR